MRNIFCAITFSIETILQSLTKLISCKNIIYTGIIYDYDIKTLARKMRPLTIGWIIAHLYCNVYRIDLFFTRTVNLTYSFLTIL